MAAALLIIGCEGAAGPEGPQGPQGEAGPIGPVGEEGSVMYAGPDDPAADIGNEGDYYLIPPPANITVLKTAMGGEIRSLY